MNEDLLNGAAFIVEMHALALDLACEKLATSEGITKHQALKLLFKQALFLSLSISPEELKRRLADNLKAGEEAIAEFDSESA